MILALALDLAPELAPDLVPELISEPILVVLALILNFPSLFSIWSSELFLGLVPQPMFQIWLQSCSSIFFRSFSDLFPCWFRADAPDLVSELILALALDLAPELAPDLVPELISEPIPELLPNRFPSWFQMHPDLIPLLFSEDLVLPILKKLPSPRTPEAFDSNPAVHP